MEGLSERNGILLKYSIKNGNLKKKYYFVDNSGILYYFQEK